MKINSRLGLLLAIAVLFVATLGTSAFSQTHHTNRGRHLVGGRGSSHKGGHYAASSRRRHLVGGHGSSHKGGRYVKN